MKFVNLVATTAATFFATSLNAATTGGRLVAAGTDGQTDTPSHTAGQPQPVENFHLVYGDGTAVFGGNKARRREKRMIATTHVSVRLQFTVGSSSYDVSMIRQPSLFEAGSTIKFADGTGEHSVEDIEAPNYRAADNAGVLTLNNDETYMKGIVVSQTLGKTLEVSGSPSGGLTAVDLVFNLNFNLDGIRLRETDSPFPATPDHDAGTRRRHSAVQRRNQNGIGFGRYTPFFGLADNDPIAPTCFEGDSTMRSVTVGIFLGSALHSTQATDRGSTAYEPPFQTINDHPPFANSGGNAINSDGNAIAHLTSWFSAANLIYEGNLNIKLLMGDIVKGTGAESWDACTETGFTKGAEGITDRALGRFQNVRSYNLTYFCYAFFTLSFLVMHLSVQLSHLRSWLIFDSHSTNPLLTCSPRLMLPVSLRSPSTSKAADTGLRLFRRNIHSFISSTTAVHQEAPLTQQALLTHKVCATLVMGMLGTLPPTLALRTQVGTLMQLGSPLPTKLGIILQRQLLREPRPKPARRKAVGSWTMLQMHTVQTWLTMALFNSTTECGKMLSAKIWLTRFMLLHPAMCRNMSNRG